jgi:hypothetical protein
MRGAGSLKIGFELVAKQKALSSQSYSLSKERDVTGRPASGATERSARSVFPFERASLSFVHADTACLRSTNSRIAWKSAPPARAHCEVPVHDEPFSVRNGGDRRAPGMGNGTSQQKKRGQPEGLDARAEQVLSWLAVLEQTRPPSGAVCLWDRSLKNKGYCFGVGVAFASGVAAAPAGVGVASPLRASLCV